MKGAAAFPTLVFADGASSGNPGPGGWGAIIVTPAGRVTELGGREDSTTNNRMELMGVIRALETLARQRESDPSIADPIDVMTDSTYVIRGITQWSWGWRKRGWKTAEGAEVANQDLWKRLIGAVAALKLKIDWKYVRGHAGIPGNERVDEIAVAFSKGPFPRLYQGPLLGYGVAIHDLPDSFEVPEQKPRDAPKAAAHSYLSLVGGVAVRHANWAACERRVKGRSGAKFKKAMSADEETKILASWGFKPSQVQNE